MGHLLIATILLFGSMTAFAHGSTKEGRSSSGATYFQRPADGGGNFRASASEDQLQCRTLGCEVQNTVPADVFVPLPSMIKLAPRIHGSRSPPSGITLDCELPPPKVGRVI